MSSVARQSTASRNGISGSPPCQIARRSPDGRDAHLVATNAGLKIEIGNIHLFEAERALGVLLENGAVATSDIVSGAQVFTYALVVAPVRVLDTGQDVRL